MQGIKERFDSLNQREKETYELSMDLLLEPHFQKAMNPNRQYEEALFRAAT